MFATALNSDYPENAYSAIFGYEMNNDIPTDAKETLEYIVKTLSIRETEIFMLKYREDMTYEEIGAEYDISKQRVQQILAKAMRKLRHFSRSEILIMGREAYLKTVAVAKQEEKRCYYERIHELETLIRKQIDATDSESDNNSGFDKKLQPDYVLNMNIHCLDLSTRSWNCLSRMGIHTIKDLFSYDNLHRISGMGQVSVHEVQDKLASFIEAMGQERSQLYLSCKNIKL
ncbi:MAG: sigma-70 family RNA polymerase sigma factor [Firmicutes bacterium]|nr:sigma-70 family RNA polymerase sigma factor [Bacillota bacterium]